MLEAVAPDPANMYAAYGVFVAFGKGSGHPAALNFGGLLLAGQGA
jgi:ribonuclease VapC